MKALDLFCGAGGASKGLLDAGFERVIGVDIKYQWGYYWSALTKNDERPNFLQHDALTLPMHYLKSFDFIWASPPCQKYSIGTIKYRKRGKEYPDLVGKTRNLLLKAGKPFVIENVVGSPLRRDLLLCGEMFNLPIIRHRIFEIQGFKCKQLKHEKHARKVTNGTAIGVWLGGKAGCFGNKEKRAKLKPTTLRQWQKAMGISWVYDKKDLAQCVPPKYAEYIGKEFLKGVK